MVSVGRRHKCRPLAAHSSGIGLSCLLRVSFPWFNPWYERLYYYLYGFSMLTSPEPVIGGFVSENKDFRWLEWATLFMVAFNYLYSIPQSETYKKIKPNALPPPKAALLSSADVQRIVLKPFKMLFAEPIVLFMTVYMAFNFAVSYSFFAAFPYTFGGQYGFTSGQQELRLCCGLYSSVDIPSVRGQVWGWRSTTLVLSLWCDGRLCPQPSQPLLVRLDRPQ